MNGMWSRFWQTWIAREVFAAADTDISLPIPTLVMPNARKHKRLFPGRLRQSKCLLLFLAYWRITGYLPWRWSFVGLFCSYLAVCRLISYAIGSAYCFRQWSRPATKSKDKEAANVLGNLFAMNA
jgi:hypothetical protein